MANPHHTRLSQSVAIAATERRSTASTSTSTVAAIDSLQANTASSKHPNRQRYLTPLLDHASTRTVGSTSTQSIRGTDAAVSLQALVSTHHALVLSTVSHTLTGDIYICIDYDSLHYHLHVSSLLLRIDSPVPISALPIRRSQPNPTCLRG